MKNKSTGAPSAATKEVRKQLRHRGELVVRPRAEDRDHYAPSPRDLCAAARTIQKACERALAAVDIVAHSEEGECVAAELLARAREALVVAWNHAEMFPRELAATLDRSLASPLAPHGATAEPDDLGAFAGRPS